MADFDLTQTDAQVQSILNDAQDAQGAGAQTTLTTDYIMLKDTSGNYHKILKDSFTEACRNVLAGLLVNNDKGTTISQIPAIASGDFGSVTPENLASVLGVAGKIYSLPNQGDTTNVNLTELTLDKTGYGVFEICETNDYSSMIIANRYATVGLQVISDSDTRPVLNLFDIEKTVAGPIIKITAKTTMQNGGVFIKAL